MYSYIDMHCDSLLRVLEQGEESLYNGAGMQSIQRMAEAGQICQFFAIFFRPEWLTQNEQVESVVQKNVDIQRLADVKGCNNRTLDEVYFEALRTALYRQVEAHSDKIAMARNFAEIQVNRRSGKASAVLTIEDGRIVGRHMEKLAELHGKGVRAITLTWNEPNCFGYPHSVEPKAMRRGLTDFGRSAIEEMNRLGILIDVSHLSDGGFYDVAALSDKPFVASHSNCRALVPHTRNLSDDMIVLLAERGGVAGLNLYPPFVNGTSSCINASERRGSHVEAGILAGADYIEALAAHVLHFIKVGGEECVGIGTDLDGMEEPPQIDCPTKMELLFEELAKKGVTSRQLDKFASGNVLRVIKDSMR